MFLFVSWVDPAGPNVASGFDQEAAAVMMARIAVTRQDSEGGGDVQRWLDRSLIKIVSYSPNLGSLIVYLGQFIDLRIVISSRTVQCWKSDKKQKHCFPG